MAVAAAFEDEDQDEDQEDDHDEGQETRRRTRTRTSHDGRQTAQDRSGGRRCLNGDDRIVEARQIVSEQSEAITWFMDQTKAQRDRLEAMLGPVDRKKNVVSKALILYRSHKEKNR